MKFLKLFSFFTVAMLGGGAAAYAQDAVSAETAFILNTFMFLVCGIGAFAKYSGYLFEKCGAVFDCGHYVLPYRV